MSWQPRVCSRSSKSSGTHFRSRLSMENGCRGQLKRGSSRSHCSSSARRAFGLISTSVRLDIEQNKLVSVVVRAGLGSSLLQGA
jgi:hypothetical protein